jgi:hypothetical protein
VTGVDYLAQDVTETFAGIAALRQVTVHFRPGEVHSLIGGLPAGRLSLAQQQLLECARALSRGCGIQPHPAPLAPSKPPERGAPSHAPAPDFRIRLSAESTAGDGRSNFQR